MMRLAGVRACAKSLLLIWFSPGLYAIAGAALAAEDKVLAGWIETAYIYPQIFPMRAKIDTGADHSSLSATGIAVFSRQGRPWVRFEAVNRWGGKVALERPLVRTARIRRPSGKSQDRPVIDLELCLAGIRKTVEVNLVDRTGLDYRLLLGRSFLAGTFVVDPAAVDLARTGCQRG